MNSFERFIGGIKLIGGLAFLLGVIYLIVAAFFDKPASTQIITHVTEKCGVAFTTSNKDYYSKNKLLPFDSMGVMGKPYLVKIKNLGTTEVKILFNDLFYAEGEPTSITFGSWVNIFLTTVILPPGGEILSDNISLFQPNICSKNISLTTAIDYSKSPCVSIYRNGTITDITMEIIFKKHH